MRFKKIKVTSDNKISLQYEVKSGTGSLFDEFSFTTSDQAKPSFHEALQALKEDVRELCELPEEYRERIFVKGGSFSYGGENEVMGATIIANMSLRESNIPLNLVTPHKASEPYSDGKADPKALLSEDCVGRLRNLVEEAEKFVKGVRAQGNLFAEATK